MPPPQVTPIPPGRQRERGANSPGRSGGAGTPQPFSGSPQSFAGAHGHRLVARLRTRGRGAASPGRRAAGGGRGRGRQGRGGRGAAWDLRRPPGAPRVLPPAPPLSPPRPASRSPPPRRVGPGRAERREIVSTANKKRRHMTRQEEGKRGEGGARRGGTERRGRREPERGKTWAGPPAARGADPPGRPMSARPSPRSTPRAVPERFPGDAAGPGPAWAARTRLPPRRGAGVTGAGPSDPGRPRPWAAGLAGGRRAACPYPSLRPRGRAGAVPLATCRRNAPTPSACLTRLESKNKKNYDAGEPCEGEKRFHFSPTTASWRGSQAGPQPSSSAHLEPREERHKGTAAPRPAGRSSCRLPARVCGGREGGHYRQPSKRPVLEATPVGRPSGWVGDAQRRDRLRNLERNPALSPSHFEFSGTRQTISRATQRPAAQPPLQVFRLLQGRATHC